MTNSQIQFIREEILSLRKDFDQLAYGNPDISFEDFKRIIVWKQRELGRLVDKARFIQDMDTLKRTDPAPPPGLGTNLPDKEPK